MPTSRLLRGCALAVACIFAVPATASAAKPTVTLSGSTSIAPLVTKLAKGYVKAFPKAAKFKVLQGGSDIGIADAARGRVTLGMASRDPQGGDPGGIVFTRIARDGVCVVTHPSNPLSSVSQETVQKIFSGQIRRWTDVPGAKATGTIQLVARTSASGTADAFKNIFMGPSLNTASSASQKATSGLVQQTVSATPSAIGYVSFEFTKGVSPASYKGVPCTLRNAKSGQYPGTRNFYLVSRGKPSGAAKKFVSWIRGSAGQRIVGNGWVPIR